MPGIVGAMQVISVGTSAVVNVGDVYRISPKSASKTFAGAGSFNTGDSIHVTNWRSATNTNDPDLFDQGIAFTL